MTRIAPRSSTTAKVSRKARSAEGRWVESTARTASAKAMSVAIGTAQPSGLPPRPRRRPGRGRRARPCRTPRRARAGPRSAGVAQLTDDQLTLELDPGDQEEDGQQPVGGPVPDRQVQAERGDPEVEVAYPLVRLAPRACSPTPAPPRPPPAAPARRPSRSAGHVATCTRSGQGNSPRKTERSRAAPRIREPPGHRLRAHGPFDADQTSRHTPHHTTRCLHPNLGRRQGAARVAARSADGSTGVTYRCAT